MNETPANAHIRICVKLVSILFAYLLGSSLFSQTKPEFEVASIRPAAPFTPGQQVNAGVKINDAHVTFTSLSLKDYIGMAFKVKYHQISGPDWIASERFDINATLPEGTRRDQLPEMMQTLLTDRLEMKHHRTSKEFPVYGLVVAKGGLKIAEIAAAEDATEAAKKPVEVSATGSRGGTTVNYGNGSAFSFGDNKFQAKKVTMANVADTLARFVDRPVVDMTGLKGIYDFNLESQPEDFQAMIIRSAIAAGITLPPQAIQLMERASGDSLPNVLQALGLKLERTKSPIEVVVIDQMLKIPTAN